MSDVSTRLDLPFIAPSQAQKHVTHNEAVQRLDLLVQMALDGFEATEPPAAPEPGARYALGQGAMGVWAGQDGQIALFLGEGWTFVAPQSGWIAAERDTGHLRVYHIGVWRPYPERVEKLGIGAQADALNRLTVASEATLLTHAGAGHQLKLNKATTGDSASLLFQTGFAGRAEMGIAGQDDFSIKVSADGTTWTEALRVNAQTGRLSGAGVQSAPNDATPGRVLTVGAQGAALGADVYRRSNILGTVSQSGGIPTGAVIERGSNANGEYVRFADGTQWCWKTIAGLGPISTPAGSIFRSESITVGSFPAVFSAPPAVLCSKSKVSSSADGWASMNGIPSVNTSSTATLYSYASRISTDFALEVKAIGRWF